MGHVFWHAMEHATKDHSIWQHMYIAIISQLTKKVQTGELRASRAEPSSLQCEEKRQKLARQSSCLNDTSQATLGQSIKRMQINMTVLIGKTRQPRH